MIEDYVIICMVFTNFINIIVTVFYFKKYRIKDFIIFGIGFVFSIYYGFYNVLAEGVFTDFQRYVSFDGPIIPKNMDMFMRIVHYLGAISVSAALLFWSIYFIRSIWYTFPLRIYLIMLLCFSGIFIIYIPLLFDNLEFLNSENGVFLRIWLHMLPLYFYSYLIYRVFVLINDTAKPTNRIANAIKLWRVAYLFVFLLVFFDTLRSIFVTFNDGYYDDSTFIPFLLANASGAIVFSLISLIAIYYPEALLIFDTHILRLQPIYEEMVKNQQDQIKNDKLRFREVEKYILALPAEIFAEIQQKIKDTED